MKFIDSEGKMSGQFDDAEDDVTEPIVFQKKEAKVSAEFHLVSADIL